MASEPGCSQAQPWGHLPAEKYLLQHWNYDDGQNRQEQYQRLVRAFLEAGDVIAEPVSSHSDESPQHVELSDEQIDVLKQWRSEGLRDIAGALQSQRSDEVVVLRTHYSDDPEEDVVMQNLMVENEDNDPNYEEDYAWWQFLNDHTVFNFGDQWEKVYDILPELTLHGLGRKSLLSSDRFAEALSHEADFGHDPDTTVQEWASLSAHPIAIVDEETFTTSQLKLVFIDVDGNVVRSTRVDTSELAIYRMTSFRGAIGDWPVWQEAEVGQRYQSDGDIGRVLRHRLEAARAV